MNYMWSRRGNRGLLSPLFGLIALLALIGGTRWMRGPRGRAAGTTGAGLLGWLVVGLVAMVVFTLIVSIGVGFLANFGFSLFFCLAPGALLAFLVLAANRARERQVPGGTQPDRSAPAWQTPTVAALEGTKTTQQPVKDALAGKTGAAPAASPARPQAQSAPVKAGPPRAAPAPEPVRHPAVYRERAAGYRQRIQSLIRKRRRGPLSDWMTAVLPKLEGWEERVGQLADRLTNFETDKLIQRDIKEVPTNIVRLQALWEAESDDAMRKQMERTLGGYREQQTQLEALTRLMRRTRFVLDDTLAAMGTIYSQMQVLDAMDIDSARAAEITGEIQEQVDRLNDLLSAYSDVNQTPPDEVADAARRIRLERESANG